MSHLLPGLCLSIWRGRGRRWTEGPLPRYPTHPAAVTSDQTPDSDGVPGPDYRNRLQTPTPGLDNRTRPRPAAQQAGQPPRLQPAGAASTRTSTDTGQQGEHTRTGQTATESASQPAAAPADVRQGSRESDSATSDSSLQKNTLSPASSAAGKTKQHSTVISGSTAAMSGTIFNLAHQLRTPSEVIKSAVPESLQLRRQHLPTNASPAEPDPSAQESQLPAQESRLSPPDRPTIIFDAPDSQDTTDETDDVPPLSRMSETQSDAAGHHSALQDIDFHLVEDGELIHLQLVTGQRKDAATSRRSPPNVRSNAGSGASVGMNGSGGGASVGRNGSGGGASVGTNGSGGGASVGTNGSGGGASVGMNGSGGGASVGMNGSGGGASGRGPCCTARQKRDTPEHGANAAVDQANVDNERHLNSDDFGQENAPLSEKHREQSSPVSAGLSVDTVGWTLGYPSWQFTDSEAIKQRPVIPGGPADRSPLPSPAAGEPSETTSRPQKARRQQYQKRRRWRRPQLPCSLGLLVTGVVANSSLVTRQNRVLELTFPFDGAWPVSRHTGRRLPLRSY